MPGGNLGSYMHSSKNSNINGKIVGINLPNAQPNHGGQGLNIRNLRNQLKGTLTCPSHFLFLIIYTNTNNAFIVTIGQNQMMPQMQGGGQN